MAEQSEKKKKAPEKKTEAEVAGERAALEQAVTALETAVSSLDRVLLEEQVEAAWAWWEPGTEPGPAPTSEREEEARALEAIRREFRRLSFEDDQAPNTTLSLVGALGVNRYILEAVEHVNACKQQLMDTAKSMNHIWVEAEVSEPRRDKYDNIVGYRQVTRRVPLVRHQIRDKMGRRRFNLLHAWRKIPVAERPGEHLESMSFTVSKGSRRLVQITAAQALTRLGKCSEAKAEERAALKAIFLKNPEQLLAWVKTIPPQMRVNYTWLPSGTSERITTWDTAPLPVVYRLDHRGKPPVVFPPNLGGTRRPRSDRQTELNPLCPSINVYKYLPGCPKEKPKKQAEAESPPTEADAAK